MKNFLLLPVILAFVFTACSSDNEASQQPITERANRNR